MTDIYQGDPKIYVNAEGADFNFPGNAGQPKMEQGVENLAVISLLTDEGWEGNFYLKTQDEKIGSGFRVANEQPITLSNLENIRQTTIKALSNPAFGKVIPNVTANVGNRINNRIVIEPPGKDAQEIVLNKNGFNWILQSEKDEEL